MSEIKPTYTHGGARPNSGGAREGAGRKPQEGYSKARKLRFLSKAEEKEFMKVDNRQIVEIVLEYLNKNSLI